MYDKSKSFKKGLYFVEGNSLTKPLTKTIGNSRGLVLSMASLDNMLKIAIGGFRLWIRRAKPMWLKLAHLWKTDRTRLFKEIS